MRTQPSTSTLTSPTPNDKRIERKRKKVKNDGKRKKAKKRRRIFDNRRTLILSLFIFGLGIFQFYHHSIFVIVVNILNENDMENRIDQPKHRRQQQDHQGKTNQIIDNDDNKEDKKRIYGTYDNTEWDFMNVHRQEQEKLLFPSIDDVIESYSSSSSSSSSSPSSSSHPTIVFVFVMGLEGTGHHIIRPLINQSPTAKYLKGIDDVTTTLASKLGSSLYSYDTTNGIWNSHCQYIIDMSKKEQQQQQNNKKNKKKQKFLQKRQQQRRLKIIEEQAKIYDDHNVDEEESIFMNSLRRLEKSNSMTTKNSASTTTTTAAAIGNYTLYQQHLHRGRRRRLMETIGPNTTKSFEKIIKYMKSIEEKIRHAQEQDEEQQRPIFMTINIWPKSIHRHMGMVSYPNYNEVECRQLNYPNLNLWYKACDMVPNVECSHVYIYRNPIDVIKSTCVKRDFNDNVHILSALHVYTSHFKNHVG